MPRYAMPCVAMVKGYGVRSLLLFQASKHKASEIPRLEWEQLKMKARIYKEMNVRSW